MKIDGLDVQMASGSSTVNDVKIGFFVSSVITMIKVCLYFSFLFIELSEENNLNMKKILSAIIRVKH